MIPMAWAAGRIVLIKLKTDIYVVYTVLSYVFFYLVLISVLQDSVITLFPQMRKQVQRGCFAQGHIVTRGKVTTQRQVLCFQA